MAVHRSSFVPPPKVASAVVHIVPAAEPAGVDPTSAGKADRGRIRPAAQDAAIEPEGRCRARSMRLRTLGIDPSGARKRSASTNMSRCARDADPSSSSELPAAWRRQAPGRLAIAVDSTATCGQPAVPHSFCSLARLSLARGSAPSSTIASPWTASASRSVGSSASALLVRRIAWPYSFSLIATVAMTVKAARFLRIDRQRRFQRIVGFDHICPGRAALRPASSARPTCGAIWSSGRWPTTATGKVEAARPRQSTSGVQAHQNLQPIALA